MTGTTKSPYTSQQISVWLRGLVSIGWADGHFDEEEQNLIAALTHQALTDTDKSKAIEPISPSELAEVLGQDSHTAENFLRTAVMVALADRCYSEGEDALLHQYCQALGLKTEILEALRATFTNLSAEAELAELASAEGLSETAQLDAEAEAAHDLLHPVRDWLDQMDIQDPKVAHFLCRMIPPQCPFERDITVFGRKVAHIPAMCKLNPLYEQLVGIRFRALSYLADDCGEDVSPYC